MKTWSIEEAFVRAYSLGAVVVQGVLDAFTYRPPYANDFPIPGCPDAGECRTYGCAGDCSESMEPDGEPLAEWEQELLDQASAVVSRNEPAERPPEVDSFPPNPSGGPPAHPDDAGADWVGWAVPAICTVLCEHFPYYDDGAAMYECVDDMGCVHASFGDTHAWREHLAPLIAVHLESALAHEFPASK